MSALAALRALSARIGADPALVQGAGGNTSEKNDGLLWVKASGTWLSDALRRDIFVPLDLAALRAAIAANDEAGIAAATTGGSGMRPSIETALHALMPQRVVVHVHSVNTIALAVRADARDVLSGRLAGLPWAWVPYARPGWPLAREVARAIAGAQPAPQVLMLGNHGCVLGADSCEAVRALLDEVERRSAAPARAMPPPATTELEALARGLSYRVPSSADAHWPALDRPALETATGGSLYPDHVVFLGPEATVARDPRELDLAIRDFRRRNPQDPPYVLVPGRGTLLRADLPEGAEPMLACLGLVVARIDGTVRLRYLSAEEEAGLLGWESEEYRRRLRRD
ncbi:MAG: class II aldolase [Burkholderiales bacterium]|nr:class II aldolase [Burkholderiales bacterium]